MEKLKPDATGIYVAAHQAPGAIEEAIEAEVPLIVAVAEHIPIHDMLRLYQIHSILKTQWKSRLVGANAPGIISAIGKCRIGFQPLPCFMPGRIGIVAKSGTLSYEAVASTTRAGLGQSLCIGMGGDVLAGTNFVDALKVFENDNDTEGIVLIGEIGGEAEFEAAGWIMDYKKRSPNPKPIAALIGGVHAAPGRIMGHAGAFTLPGEPDALRKIRFFEHVGVTMVNHPAKFGDAMKQLLGQSGRATTGAATTGASQRRSMHTIRRIRPTTTSTRIPTQQKRSIYLHQDDSFDLLRERGIKVSEDPGNRRRRLLAIGIDRENLSPCVITSAPVNPSHLHLQPYLRKFPFDYRTGPDSSQLSAIASRLGLKSSTSLNFLIDSLISLYNSKEAFLLETTFIEEDDTFKVVTANFGFDDAAFRSTGRQSEIHALRRTSFEDPHELEAEKDGIVYIKFRGPGNIGTLVNGAGLAMNTVDALADAGGQAANFLDTGGKATSETVKKSFQVILADKRVKVIFVNIFGGLTLGDMIARGVLLAFEELEMRIPVVVRIRGTNEKEGQRIVSYLLFYLRVFPFFDAGGEILGDCGKWIAVTCI
ncbi:succinyl- synthetase subunit alpha protein [Rutstroemia sp. NJR-2017a BBW]|nr:succinyl- synthetase subunit alpha protein [Rutstroemia sp. NJR-2017a BBW]